jgi:c-di-AMP phosphodiesterase-like protein
MPKFILKTHGLHMLTAYTILIVVSVLLMFAIHWAAGLLLLLITAALVFFTISQERRFREETKKYIATLSHRVRRANNEVVIQMPIGIILYNDEQMIEWHNPFVQQMVEEEGINGRALEEVIPSLAEFDFQQEEGEIVYRDRIYRVISRQPEKLLYLQDVTEHAMLVQHYNAEKPVFGIVHLDNLDEVTQGIDEQNRNLLMTTVAKAVTDWANKHGMFLRRYASDKFFVVTDWRTLQVLENKRFDILDTVRSLTADNKYPITLSIGIGAGVDSLIELGAAAQSSLDIALARGGDQAAVRVQDRLSFYGGKSNAVEKRTRVRARVIAHALRDLILESDHVLITGHQDADLDSLGSAIGVLKTVQTNGKDGYIVLDKVNPAIAPLMKAINRHPALPQWIVTPEQGMYLSNKRSLLIMVDTHKPSMIAEPRLLETTKRVVVIDHHRRGEEFVTDPLLIYIEPYASSTSELVTELLQYQNAVKIDELEATAMLAGIVVDTKSFAMRTGSRTFEAASFLRSKGADPVLVQRFLKEDLEQYIRRNQLVQNTELAYTGIAIASGDEDNAYGQVTIAQAADTLLNMSGITASFVVAKRPDGLIGISARSLGDINVQVIMERMGGGGHLTNAAVQLEDMAVEEAVEQLKAVLEEWMEEQEGSEPEV